jgi:glycerol-3-phosphate acyltransferase PlsX
MDAMGGDHAPVETVKGALAALGSFEGTLVLYGDEEQILAELGGSTPDGIEIAHCTEVVENDDKPVIAIKRKKDASMVRGLVDLRKGEIDAFLSAGNSGALLAGGLLKVGRLKGLDRPALTTVFPTEKGMCILVDAGANPDVKLKNFAEFAIMGSVYAEAILEIDQPTVGLVNVGAEKTKGSSLYQEAHLELEKAPIRFVGNVEARDLMKGDVSVIVADGFTGNIILKLAEGFAGSFGRLLKESLLSSLKGKIGGLLIKDSLGTFKKKMDYTEYGGAPLLGVKGLVVKAHGSSNAKAFKNAIRYAVKAIEQDVNGAIEQKLTALYPEE